MRNQLELYRKKLDFHPKGFQNPCNCRILGSITKTQILCPTPLPLNLRAISAILKTPTLP